MRDYHLLIEFWLHMRLVERTHDDVHDLSLYSCEKICSSVSSLILLLMFTISPPINGEITAYEGIASVAARANSDLRFE